MIRKEGFYWVKKIGIWGIAYWCPNDRLGRAYGETSWFLAGDSHPKSNEYFDEIDDTRLER